MNIFGIILIIGLINLATSQSRPNSKYSLHNMPQTSFTCRDKILGGYYADAETNCQMFHICVKIAGVGIQDFRFLCPNGTAFDQEAQICADWGDVDCENLYYGNDNFDLYRIGSNFESKKSSYAEEEESFHLQRAETSDARRSKQYIVNQNKQSTAAATTRSTSTVRPQPSFPPSTTSSTTTTTTTAFRPTFEYTTTRVAVSTYRPTSQPKNLFNDNSIVSTYRPSHNFLNTNPRNAAGNGDDEILRQSQSSHFFNNKNNGKEDNDDEKVRSTKAPIKQKVRGRQRGRSKFRSINSVTQTPSRNSAAPSSEQKVFTEQQPRQSFTTTPIVVQPVSHNRFDYDNFRTKNTSNAQATKNIRTTLATTTQSPKRAETFFDVPKVNPKTQTTKLNSASAQNVDFSKSSSTVSPQNSNPIDLFQRFGAIPQRVIIPSKLSPEQRLALQASNNNNFQSTAASISTSSTTEIPLNQQFVPQFNRQHESPNQLRTNSEQKAPQKNFNILPQKFNFKTQKYEAVEPQNPTTQFYNPSYETKGTDQPIYENFNLEPTRSGFTKQNNKTYATRQLTAVTQEESKPTTFNPQQYYQAEQSQYQNLSPRGFSLAAQKQQPQLIKTTQSEVRPQITSRSESRNHKKFSTLVPKDQYNPTTFKPNNNFSKKPVDSIASQKLEKIQNPNKYYSQFTTAQTTHSPLEINTSPQSQFNNYNTQQSFQHNNFQHHTTRQSNFFSTTTTARPLAEGEEDDGQYRPELYEKDFFRNKAKTTKITPAPLRNNFNNFFQVTSSTEKIQNNFNSGEDEFLKTAHSQNIFASGNQLRAEKEKEKTIVKFNDYSTEKSSPRPFSKPTQVTSSTSKPKKQKEEKDVSYDYQYYDTNSDQHDYSELDTIEDFGKTNKKSSSN